MANVIYDNEKHRIVMTAIVWREIEGEYQYLLIKRSPDKKVFPNMWTVPGGGLEPSDYVDSEKTKGHAWYFVLEKALKREVTEEVGVEIDRPVYLLDLVFIRPDNVPVLTLSYYTKYIGGEVVLEEGDSTEWKWVSSKEASEMDLIPGIPEEIEMVDRILRGEKDAKINL